MSDLFPLDLSCCHLYVCGAGDLIQSLGPAGKRSTTESHPDCIPYPILNAGHDPPLTLVT